MTRSARPVNTTELYDQVKRILTAVAVRVRADIRLKLEGRGRGEAEIDDLVNDAFIQLVEALPRFNPATAKLTTFVYGLARRRMWMVARAEFFGISPEQLHRMDAAQYTPRYHRDIKRNDRQVFQAVETDAETRNSVRKVEAIRRQLPLRDRRLIDCFLRCSGNRAEMDRRRRMSKGCTQNHLNRLYERIRRM